MKKKSSKKKGGLDKKTMGVIMAVAVVVVIGVALYFLMGSKEAVAGQAVAFESAAVSGFECPDCSGAGANYKAQCCSAVPGCSWGGNSCSGVATTCAGNFGEKIKGKNAASELAREESCVGPCVFVDGGEVTNVGPTATGDVCAAESTCMIDLSNDKKALSVPGNLCAQRMSEAGYAFTGKNTNQNLLKFNCEGVISGVSVISYQNSGLSFLDAEVDENKVAKIVIRSFSALGCSNPNSLGDVLTCLDNKNGQMKNGEAVIGYESSCELPGECAEHSQCDDGNSCTQDICKPNSETCAHIANANLGASCCTSSFNCADGEFCDVKANSCESKGDLGSLCVGDQECAEGTCVNNVCFDPAQAIASGAGLVPGVSVSSVSKTASSEVCDNNVDDNGDGKVDCFEDACFSTCKTNYCTTELGATKNSFITTCVDVAGMQAELESLGSATPENKAFANQFGLAPSITSTTEAAGKTGGVEISHGGEPSSACVVGESVDYNCDGCVNGDDVAALNAVYSVNLLEIADAMDSTCGGSGTTTTPTVAPTGGR